MQARSGKPDDMKKKVRLMFSVLISRTAGVMFLVLVVHIWMVDRYR